MNAPQPPGWPPDEEAAAAAARSLAQQLAADKLAARIAELEQLPAHLPQVPVFQRPMSTSGVPAARSEQHERQHKIAGILTLCAYWIGVSRGWSSPRAWLRRQADAEVLHQGRASRPRTNGLHVNAFCASQDQRLRALIELLAGLQRRVRSEVLQHGQALAHLL